RSGAQIVAVGKAAREADEVETLWKLGVPVPDHDRRRPAGLFERDGEVAVAIGAGEDDDGALHACVSAPPSARSMRKFSMTVLARSLRHIASTCSSPTDGSRSSSISLPARTSLTPSKPRPSSAWWIAFPWGSS